MSVDQVLTPVETIEDLISKNRRQLFFTIEDDGKINSFNVTFPKPENNNDIQSITIYKKGTKVETKVRPSITYKTKGLDSQRYTINHINAIHEFHNEAAVEKLFRKISCDGYLTHKDDAILRVRTKDNRVYAVYQGTIFSISQTLRLTRIFGTIPNSKIEEIVEGEYEAKNLKFTFEKQAFPKRDLTFS